MLLSLLINLQVVTKKPYHFHGLIRDVCMSSTRVELLLLSPGSYFRAGAFLFADASARIEGGEMTLQDAGGVRRLRHKAMREMLEKFVCLSALRVYDKNGIYIGKVEDAQINPDGTIREYILSRSFFDDIDNGFIIVPAADILCDVEKKRLIYPGKASALPSDPRQSGLVCKLFGYGQDGKKSRKAKRRDRDEEKEKSLSDH